MKNFIVLFIFIVSAIQGVLAQTPTTTVEFTPVVWNFGAIREVDGPVSQTFKYRNTGNNPYVIYEISTSCGCTTSSYDRSPLLPGDEREMAIVFDPTNQPGHIEKSIMVRGNVANGTTLLKIRATVEPRPRTIEDDYPVALSDGVRLQDLVLEIGTSPNSRQTTATLGVVNTSDKPVNLAVVGDKLPSWVEVKTQDATLQANQKSNIIVSIKPSNDMWGKRAFAIPILVNLRAQYLSPTANTIFIEDLTEAASTSDRARASLSSYFYHFSTVKQNSKTSHKFTITNTGTATLHLRHFDHSENVKISTEKNALAPKESTSVTIWLKTDKPGPVNEIIRIITNDPLKPVQEFRTMATVVKN